MKVLIIDDEPLVRRSLARAFTAKGHAISSAEDGALGLKLWQNEIPDLVLLDVLMPIMTGPQVLQNISPELRSRTKVIVMSAFTGNIEMQESHHNMGDRFLAKPFEDIFNVVKIAEELCAHE